MHALLKRVRPGVRSQRRSPSWFRASTSSYFRTSAAIHRWSVCPTTKLFSSPASHNVEFTTGSELLTRSVQDKQALHKLLADTPPEVQSAFAAEILCSSPPIRDGVLEHLSEHEVRALCVATFAKHFNADFQTEFAKADTDASGFINKAEFKRYLTGMAQKASGSEETAKPTSRQLSIFALNTAIPMLVFGFLDNSIMIIGGDVVDDVIGTTFQLSTLACAALANTFADVFGISIGNSVEALTVKMGVPQAHLTSAQSALPIVKRVSFLAAGLGIMVGCILGMVPLLFINQDVKVCKEVFERIDVDGSGLITVEELHDALNSLGIKVSMAAVEQAVQGVDQDDDKKINFDEFYQLFVKLRRG